jgi:hypothetical protein
VLFGNIVDYFMGMLGKYLAYNCETEMTGREKDKQYEYEVWGDVIWFGSLEIEGAKG